MNKPSTRIKPTLLCGFAFFALLTFHQVFAAPHVDEVKAAYLYNLTKFISVRNGAGNNYRLCLLSPISNSRYYQELSGNRANNLTIQVLSVSENEVESCNMVYTQAQNTATIERLANKAVQSRFILVGDHRSFVEKGGMVGFVQTGNNIKFGLNKRNFERAKLHVSAKLYQLAIFIL